MSSGFKSDCIKYYRKYVMDYMIKNFNGTGPGELINLDMTNIKKLEMDYIFIKIYKKLTNDFIVDLIFPELVGKVSSLV